jgi:hypothetical protein
LAYYALKYVVLFENEVHMIEGYSTVKSIAEKWSLTERTVQIMCAEGKIIGATKFGGVWAIPSDAKKPTDNRVVSGEYKNWRKKKHEEEAL